MPRNLIPTSTINKHGIIHLACNHSWIPTISKSLSLVYYITNYATKDDISPLQMVTKAALMKQAIDHANNTQAPTTIDLQLRQRGMDNFALRCFNSLSQDCEVSGVQVASTLLQLPSYYTINYNFTRINLCIQDATSQDVNFDPNHPRHLSHVQHLALSPRQTATVTLQGQLTEFQTAKDSLPGGHPDTNAILNNIAEILLGLFQINTSPTILSAIDDDLDDQPGFNNDDSHRDPVIDKTFNTKTLLTAFFFIRKAWDRELHNVQLRITALHPNSLPSLFFDFECLRPLDVSSSVLYEASGLRFLPPTTLQEWQISLKDLNSLANSLIWKNTTPV
ncbi:hypothetical protein BJX63DRAFT_426386 [Aspergillus granulosus]|uniref:Uncharacterized protein n=1 Tax=Aspergillus granulosus TaxID=176169 RepID=A0ABR4GSE4_9EURO